MAWELGADAVITNLGQPAERMAAVLDGLDIPVLFAGGPRMDTEADLLAAVQSATEIDAFGGFCLPAGQPGKRLLRLASALDLLRSSSSLLLQGASR
jgi:hypothetical protein